MKWTIIFRVVNGTRLNGTFPKLTYWTDGNYHTRFKIQDLPVTSPSDMTTEPTLTANSLVVNDRYVVGDAPVWKMHPLVRYAAKQDKTSQLLSSFRKFYRRSAED
jgi:hypothetical protein